MDKSSEARQKIKGWRDTGTGRFKETVAEARPFLPPALLSRPATTVAYSRQATLYLALRSQVLAPFVKQEAADESDANAATVEEARPPASASHVPPPSCFRSVSQLTAAGVPHGLSLTLGSAPLENCS